MKLFGQEIVLGEKIEKLNRVDISKIAISENGEVIKKEDADKSDEREAYIKKLVQSNIDQQNKIALLSAKVYKLQKENEEIKANADYQLEGRDLEIKELKAQIEKMKNCKNCANYMISGKCPSFFRTGWCKNWEMTRSKK
jgi:hypothetical protein